MTNINIAQCRMARAALRIGVRELARRAKMSPTTITMWEGKRSHPTLETLDAIRKVLEAEGIVFVNGGDMPGVRVPRAWG